MNILTTQSLCSFTYSVISVTQMWLLSQLLLLLFILLLLLVIISKYVKQCAQTNATEFTSVDKMNWEVKNDM